MLSLKMPDIDNVIIAGYLTSDPILRQTANGTKVANFCIASRRKFKDHSGHWRENLCLIGVVAWHKLSESCSDFLKKGSSVLVEGELFSRTWNNEDGTKYNIVEIKARRIQFLDKHANKRGSSSLDELQELPESIMDDINFIEQAKDEELSSSNYQVKYENLNYEN